MKSNSITGLNVYSIHSKGNRSPISRSRAGWKSFLCFTVINWNIYKILINGDINYFEENSLFALLCTENYVWERVNSYVIYIIKENIFCTEINYIHKYYLT